MNRWSFRPARDLDLPLAAQFRSARREPGLAGLAVHWTWSLGVSAYLALFHRLRISGRENLPAAPPFVLVGNHSSHLDALSLGAALPRSLAHRVFSLAAGDVFFANLATSGFAALAVNALPIWRQGTTSADLALLRQRLLEDGLVFILFPEGTRNGAMGRFRPGIGALVAGTAVPVLPCYLHGAHAAWPPGQTLPRRGRLRLCIGQARRFAGTANDQAGWREIAGQLEQDVRALAPAS